MKSKRAAQKAWRGAVIINFFRWDTTTFGTEQYWHGMLRHDRSHSPGFDEIRRTLGELKSIGHEALNASYDAEFALCFDSNSDWALGIQPGQPKLNYFSEMLSWYGALVASRAGIDIVNATQGLSRYKVLCSPSMYVVSQQQADKIRAFVEAGGTFIAGFHLGVKDSQSRIVNTPLPGLLRDVMGVEVSDYQPIYSEKQSVQFAAPLAGNKADCHLWADILDSKNADVLATYTGGAYAGRAAITSHNYGKGKAVYLGAHLEPGDLGRVLLALTSSKKRHLIQAPSGVEVTSRSKDQRTWVYVLNHTANPQSIQIDGRYQETLSRSAVSGSIALEPYGVRVLTQG